MSQSSNSSINTDSLRLQENKWVTLGLHLDTLYNPYFKPFPIFTKANSNNTIGKLLVQIDSIDYNIANCQLYLKGEISGAEFQGWGSEVFIFVGFRLDSVITSGWFHGDFHPVDTIECIYLKDISYCYTNCKFEKTKNSINFDCHLNVKNQNDILVIARNEYITEIFDLERLKYIYGH